MFEEDVSVFFFKDKCCCFFPPLFPVELASFFHQRPKSDKVLTIYFFFRARLLPLVFPQYAHVSLLDILNGNHDTSKLSLDRKKAQISVAYLTGENKYTYK